jgi:hypothetical protein
MTALLDLGLHFITASSLFRGRPLGSRYDLNRSLQVNQKILNRILHSNTHNLALSPRRLHAMTNYRCSQTRIASVSRQIDFLRSNVAETNEQGIFRPERIRCHHTAYPIALPPRLWRPLYPTTSGVDMIRRTWDPPKLLSRADLRLVELASYGPRHSCGSLAGESLVYAVSGN